MAKSKHVPYHAEAYPLPLGFNGRLAGIYRWFSGRPLNGHRYTDATGFRYGTMATDLSGRATQYQLLPGYKRFLYARVPIMVAPAAAVAFAVEPGQSSMAALGLATLGAREVDRWRRTRRFRKQVTEPVAKGVAAILKARSADGQGHTWVHVPENFRDDPAARIKINLPPEWIGDKGDKARMAELVASRLNLEELSPSWSWTNGRHTVEFSQPVQPPKDVSFADGLAVLDMAKDTELVMGLGTGGRPEIFSLAMESPHLLIAGGSGAGKSVLLAWLVGQFMRRGYGVTVLDSKFLSHMWLRRVPGVLYASEAEELHDALLWLEDEMFRRARARAKGDMTGFQPLVVVMEEMAGATNRLRQHWATIKGPGDPQQSPAITAMVNLSSMGRELLMHVLMAGQSMTAKTVGGPENRENFAGRTLARATAAQWRMLAPQIKPAPTKREAPGRWHLVVGDTLRKYQAPFLDLKDETDPDATAKLIEWATGGADRPDVPALLADWLAAREEEEAWEAGTASSEAYSSPPGVSLNQFAEQQGMTRKTLDNWKSRPLPGVPFPAEVGIGANRIKLYDPDHLRTYVRARLREPVEVGED